LIYRLAFIACLLMNCPLFHQRAMNSLKLAV